MDKPKIAVVVGRFQSDRVCYELHEFIKSLEYKYEKVAILVGLAPVVATRVNPLDFEARKLMIRQTYPTVHIGYIKDVRKDKDWSVELDKQINMICLKHRQQNIVPDAVIYGGAETVIDKYTGEFPIEKIPNEKYVNEAAARKQIKGTVKESADFRRGVIWAVENQFPKVYPTVDIAIYDEDKNRLLLGRKADEEEYRFVGGFVDPNETAEYAAVRETKEETDLTVTDLKFLGTHVIDDWRYRDSNTDCIMTVFFKAKYDGGLPRPMDDIAELKWFNVEEINTAMLNNSHGRLFNVLLKNLYKK